MASKHFDRDPTDNTAWTSLSRPICYGVVGVLSGMDTLHLNVAIPDKQQLEVVWAKFWNGFP